MPSSSGYGAYNPAAVDPYPIETDLAKLAVGNSPENAANLLDLYQLQRTTDAANYGHEMGIQHDFAKQQLAQQLKETYLKNAMDAVKTRGGLSVYNQLAPEAQISPSIAGPIETGLSDAQAATTAEHAASAAKHGLEAGFSTDLPRLTGMSGGLLTGQTVPLSLQVQASRNAGHGEGGGKGGPPDAGATGVRMTPYGPENYSLPNKWSPEKKEQWRAANLPRVEQSADPNPLPGNSGSPATPPATPRSGTNLTPNPARAKPGVVANESPGVKAKQQAFMDNMSNPKTQAHPGFPDIVAGAKTNGGRPQVDPHTGQFIGASGARY